MILGLHKYTLGDIDVFYSDELLNIGRSGRLDDELALEFLIDGVIRNFLKEYPKYEEFVDFYAQKRGLSRKAILAAHGSSRNNKWYYTNGTEDFRVQSWINQIDGKYATLILYCCNPGHHEITAKKSAVISSNDIYSGLDQKKGGVVIELFIPRMGYIDSYIIDYELEQMKKGLKK